VEDDPPALNNNDEDAVTKSSAEPDNDDDNDDDKDDKDDKDDDNDKTPSHDVVVVSPQDETKKSEPAEEDDTKEESSPADDDGDTTNLEAAAEDDGKPETTKEESSPADDDGDTTNPEAAAEDDDRPEITKKEEPPADDDENDKKNKESPTAKENLPPRPIKRARTAYFIFTDDKRSKVQSEVRTYVCLRVVSCLCKRNHDACWVLDPTIAARLINPSVPLLVLFFPSTPAKAWQSWHALWVKCGPSLPPKKRSSTNNKRLTNENASPKNWKNGRRQVGKWSRKAPTPRMVWSFP
jgi:hypothetical protein